MINFICLFFYCVWATVTLVQIVVAIAIEA